MVKRMLIDAAHPGETRVAVVDGNHLHDFDFENEDKRQLKGNVYLAKVTRVEPSLQAAFVEYGGGRHGFLAFSEIHPDYYRVPVADREALLAEVEDAAREAAADDDPAGEDDGDSAETDASAVLGDDPRDTPEPESDETPDDEGEAAKADAAENTDDGEPAEAADEGDHADDHDEDTPPKPGVETVGGEDNGDRARRRLQQLRNRYRIQEVIKRRQILLVQVTKEERGNKGAALTTYLSLAGRYCVLMPNTPRGGGISRKIANPKDRRRMKQILEALGVPDGMAIILRTAGLERTKQEIRRDADYLMRLWDQIRENTLESSAPTLIHEEGNLIKRAIRDLHSRDIEEILVSGDDGYKAAKDFMRTLVPSHARRVKTYRNPTVPLFHRHRVETQIDALHNPVVHLKSGGYIVINPTEALVSIDVNSGKSTRERNIEETAYRTNLEAAQEVGRQLRLRDLAGLIVIDFIDMDENRHNAAVERRIKEAMRLDRARVQIGRISHFGLLELSRQRLRPSLLELDYDVCKDCGGTGQVRTLGSSARTVLRAIEEEGIRQRYSQILVSAPTDVVVTLFNEQRESLRDVEERYQLEVVLGRDDSLTNGDQKLEGLAPKAKEDRLEVERFDDEVEADEPEIAIAEDEEESTGKKRRRRRSRRGRKSDDAGQDLETAAEGDGDGEKAESVEASDGEEAPRKRRRGRRGGRRRNSSRSSETADEAVSADAADETADKAEAASKPVETAAEETPKARPRRPRRRKPAAAATAEDSPQPNGSDSEPIEVKSIPIQVPEASGESEIQEPGAPPEPPHPVGAEEITAEITGNSARQAEAVAAEEPDRPAKRGWWRRVLDG
ncbi:MAG: Rne/Rng family ribonuclease, partial [Pseudomonadota bacterium]